MHLHKAEAKAEVEAEVEAEAKEEAMAEGARAVVLNLVNCLMEAISPVGGDIACQQNHV